MVVNSGVVKAVVVGGGVVEFFVLYPITGGHYKQKRYLL